MESSRRRKLLRAIAGIGTVGVAGCNSFNNVKVTPDEETEETPAETQTPTPGLPTETETEAISRVADFEFGFVGQQVTIEHVDGDPIPADQLRVEYEDTAVLWHELGSTSTSASAAVTVGNVATVGPSVLNWPAAIDETGSVRVVYVAADGSETPLDRFGPEDRNTETPVPADETPTPADNSETLFLDEFDDGEFLDRWTYEADEVQAETDIEERNGRLVHTAPSKYGDEYHGDLLTQEVFQTNGRIRVTARIRTLRSDYWGYGFGLQFSNNNEVLLMNHRWEAFDRFAVYGVVNPPQEFVSDVEGYGDQSNVAELELAATEPEFETYSMTIDLDAAELTRVERGLSVYVENIDIGSLSSRFQLRIGGDGGHEIEVDYIKLEAV